LAETPVIRLFRFRPVRAAFDAILRDVMIPDLRALPGLLDQHVGRRGPDELGPRVVASIWSSREAMAEALGEDFDPPRFHPEYLEETVDRELEVLPLAVDLRFEAQGPARIMRTLRGRVRRGERDAYVEEARIGTLADVDARRGPLALYLGIGPEADDFLTVSVWNDWSAIEAATGGDIQRPVATRHPERIMDWDASHYEIIEA
jgi:hypothetical protein